MEEVYDTGEYETLYNIRVADYHTYFVSGELSGIQRMAHNACEYWVNPNTNRISVRYQEPGGRVVTLANQFGTRAELLAWAEQEGVTLATYADSRFSNQAALGNRKLERGVDSH